MAEACKATGGAGLSHSRGYEDAINSRISGEVIGNNHSLQINDRSEINKHNKYLEVESTLPENIKERALSVFKSAVAERYPIKDAIEKVQKEALCEIETVFKGQMLR